MKKYKYLLGFLVGAFVLSAVFAVFLASKSRAAFWSCQLSVSSPHGTTIWVGDRVTWTLTSNIVEGKSYWFGTKNGVLDANNTETGLGTYFSWQTDPYPSSSIGSYTRYIVIRDLSGNTLCTTNTVSMSVINPSAPTVYIYNLTEPSRNPTFWTGDYLRMAVSGLTPNQTKTIESCHTYSGSSGCDIMQITTDSNGAWRTEFQVLGISLGNWTRWVRVDNITSNLVSYTVVNAASPTPTLPAIISIGIDGPTSVSFYNQGMASYKFTAQSNTQDSTLIYKVNWGDNLVTQTQGPNNALQGVSLSHQWTSSGIYNITFSASLPTNTAVYKTTTISVKVSLAEDSDNSPDYTKGIFYSVTPNNYPDLFIAGVGRGIYTGGGVCIYGTEPNPTSCKPTSNTYTTYYDHCASPTQLNEAFVNASGKLGAYGAQAPSGFVCSNGAFVKAAFVSPTPTPSPTPVSLSIVSGLCIQLSQTYGEKFVDVNTGQVSINGNLSQINRTPGVTAGVNTQMDFYVYIPEGQNTAYIGTAYSGSAEARYFLTRGALIAKVQSGNDGTIQSITHYTPWQVGCANYTRPTATPSPTPTLTPTPTPTCYWWEPCYSPTPTPTPTLTPTPMLTPTLTPTPAPTPTPIPTPTPTISPSPPPSPTPTPTIIPTKIYPLSEIYDGDLIRGQGDIAVWIVKIVGEKRYKRWLFGPQIFNAYGHLGFNKVKNISKETLNKFDTSNLIRRYDDARVYELTDFVPGKSATRRWIPTLEIFLQRGFDFDSVYVVNYGEFNLYTEGSPLPITQLGPSDNTGLLRANLSETMLRFFGLGK